jgi:hypothetical protein
MFIESPNVLWDAVERAFQRAGQKVGAGVEQVTRADLEAELWREVSDLIDTPELAGFPAFVEAQTGHSTLLVDFLFSTAQRTDLNEKHGE